MQRQVHAAQEIAQLITQGTREVVGPGAAAIKALARAGIKHDNNHNTWTAPAGKVLPHPLEAPRKTVRRFLLEAFQQAQLEALAKRRPRYEASLRGVDKWATLRELKSIAAESTAAALRAVMGGSTVTEDVACKWLRARARVRTVHMTLKRHTIGGSAQPGPTSD